MNWEDLTQLVTQKNSYILQAFLVVFASLILDFAQRKVLNRLHLKAEKTKRIWDDAIIDSIKKPAAPFSRLCCRTQVLTSRVK